MSAKDATAKQKAAAELVTTSTGFEFHLVKFLDMKHWAHFRDVFKFEICPQNGWKLTLGSDNKVGKIDYQERIPTQPHFKGIAAMLQENMAKVIEDEFNVTVTGLSTLPETPDVPEWFHEDLEQELGERADAEEAAQEAEREARLEAMDKSMYGWYDDWESPTHLYNEEGPVPVDLTPLEVASLKLGEMWDYLTRMESAVRVRKQVKWFSWWCEGNQSDIRWEKAIMAIEPYVRDHRK